MKLLIAHLLGAFGLSYLFGSISFLVWFIFSHTPGDVVALPFTEPAFIVGACAGALWALWLSLTQP